MVFIVETNRDKDGNELEKIRGIFGTKTKDFVTAVDEKNIIVVKEVGENEGYEELNKIAESMVNLFRADADSDVLWHTERLSARSKRYPDPTRRRGWHLMSARSSSRRRM